MSEQVLCQPLELLRLTAQVLPTMQTVGGTLGVTGATTTAGITNTGNVGTGTLSTTGAATLNSAGVTNNLTVGGVTQLNGTNGLQFDAGQNVSEISTDGTLVDNSNTALPTEQAVKTYVDAQVGNQDLQEAYIDGNTITTSLAEGDVVITGTEQLVVSTTNGVDGNQQRNRRRYAWGDWSYNYRRYPPTQVMSERVLNSTTGAATLKQCRYYQQCNCGWNTRSNRSYNYRRYHQHR